VVQILMLEIKYTVVDCVGQFRGVDWVKYKYLERVEDGLVGPGARHLSLTDLLPVQEMVY
jgi:hypothetical protein